MIRFPAPSTASPVSDAAAPPPIAAEPLPAWHPRCFDLLQRTDPLDGAVIGQCFKVLRDLRQLGQDDAELSARLYHSIATAPRIELMMVDFSRPHLEEAQRAFRENALDPSTFASAPEPGIRIAYDWLAREWPPLTLPKRGPPPLSVVLDKPTPTHERQTVVNTLSLSARLMCREAPPGATLATTAAVNALHRPKCLLKLQEDRTLTLEFSPFHSGQPSAMARWEEAQVKVTELAATCTSLDEFMEAFNPALDEDIRLQLNDIGQDPAVRAGRLTPAPDRGPQRTLQCSYVALGGMTEDTQLLRQAPDLAARLSKAGNAARALERQHTLRTQRHLGQPGAQPRPGLVRGCATQWLMELTSAAEQRLQPPATREAQITLSFHTPLSRTVTLLQPFEQALLQNVCADHPSAIAFVRDSLTEEHRTLARKQFGSVTAMVLQTLMPMQLAIVQACHQRSWEFAVDKRLPGTLEWPTIGLQSGTPRVSLSLHVPAAPQPRPASPVESPRTAPGLTPEGPDPAPEYLAPTALSGSFDDSLEAAREQPHWLQAQREATEGVDLSDSGPVAMSFHPLGGASAPRTGAGSVGLDRPEPLSVHNFDACMDDFVQQIRTCGNWTGFSAELGPRFLVDCAAWPAHRSLDIVNHKTGGLIARSGQSSSHARPATIALNMHRNHYSPVLQGKVLKAPANGNCFYHSAIAALGKEDRLVLLRAIGAHEGSVDHATQALREHFAAHLDLNRDEYRDRIIELHSQLEG